MTSPFLPGARVAIGTHSNWSPTTYREAFVDKVYKTGRFTLVGDPQQWRPHEPSNWNNYWSASETGSGYSRGSLRIWDDASDAEIKDAIARRARFETFGSLHGRIERIRFSDKVTDDVIEHMRAIVEAMK